MLLNNNFGSSYYAPTVLSLDELSKRRKIIKERLWVVHDAYVDNPKERFLSTAANALSEMMMDGYGPLSNDVAPTDLVTFVNQMMDAFRITPHRYEAEDVIYEMLYYMDVVEPYYLFTDSAVSLIQGGNINKTYRHRETGRVIEPDQCELFSINFGWDFIPYKAAMRIIHNPLAKQAMAGYATTGQNGAPITKTTVLDEVIKCVYGTHVKEFYWTIEQALSNRYQNDDDSDDYDRYTSNSDEQRGERTQIDFDLDFEFYLYASVAVLLWLRSPQAMQYLIKCNPVYGQLLTWNDSKGHPEVIPGTDNWVLVTGRDVYTNKHIHVVDTPAGTCISCNQSLHCTKFVNVAALKEDPCTCGKLYLDPMEQSFREHKPTCNLHKVGRFEFVCQKCMYDHSFGQQPKCGRTTCPNTKCGWHMGEQARVRALTEKRKLMLTGPSQ